MQTPGPADPRHCLQAACEESDATFPVSNHRTMSSNGKDSVQILDAVTNAARRGSIAQLKRLLGRERSRFGMLLAAKGIPKNEKDDMDAGQINATSDMLQARKCSRKVRQSFLGATGLSKA